MSATYWMLFHHCSTCTETMGPFWFLFLPPSLFFTVMCVNSTRVSTPFLLVFFNLCLFHYNLGLLFQWIFLRHSPSFMVIAQYLWSWTVSLAHFIPLSHPFSCIPYLVSSSKSTLLTPSPLPFVAHLLAFWPSLSHSETALSLFTSTAVSTVAGVNDQQYWATEILSNYSYGKSMERT